MTPGRNSPRCCSYREDLTGIYVLKEGGMRVGIHSFMLGLGKSFAFAQSKRDEVDALQTLDAWSGVPVRANPSRQQQTRG